MIRAIAHACLRRARPRPARLEQVFSGEWRAIMDAHAAT
jgi:hypothetical protein